MTRFIFVANDTTPQAMQKAIAEELQAEIDGDDITVCAPEESLAQTNWEKAGYSVVTVVGSAVFKDAEWLVLGASADSTFERSMARLAKASEIKIAVLVDIAGAHRRLGDVLDGSEFFFAVNPAAEATVRADFSQAKVTVVGSTAVKKTAPHKATQAAVAAFRKQEGLDGVITWIAGESVDDLELITDILFQKMTEYGLVMGLHPNEDKWPDKDRILEIVAPLKEAGRLLEDIPKGSSTVAKAIASDFAVGGFSLTMDEAIYNGVPTFSAITKGSLEHFGRVCPGVEEFPLVGMGLSPAICDPVDFQDIPCPTMEQIEEQLKPFDAEMVCDILLE